MVQTSYICKHILYILGVFCWLERTKRTFKNQAYTSNLHAMNSDRRPLGENNKHVVMDLWCLGLAGLGALASG